MQNLDPNIFTANTLDHVIFRAEVEELIHLTNPLARAIVCLESPHTGPADVMIFVAAALIMYEDTFKAIAKCRTPGPQPPVEDITHILNRRYKELINSRNGHDVYLVALMLHPGKSNPHSRTLCLTYTPAYLSSDVLRDPNPLSMTIPLSTPIATASAIGRPPRKCSDAAYQRGGKYLYQLAQDLRDSKLYPMLSSLTPSELFHKFVNSWDAYTRLEWPFSDYTPSVSVREWWIQISQSSLALVLSVRFPPYIYCMLYNLGK